jgi:hypothetical protein
MRFDKGIAPKYKKAIEDAVAVILEKGNMNQKFVAKEILESDLLIKFVPLAEIGCSGVTGLIDNVATNRKIASRRLSIQEALGEVYIKFSDWCWDVVGARACEGTFVHEGLHAYDFARIISSYSYADQNPSEIVELSLYDLEHRGALTSADYLVRIGKPDYLDDGFQLSLVKLDAKGKPMIDKEGILSRLEHAYGVTAKSPGIAISNLLGLQSRSVA